MNISEIFIRRPIATSLLMAAIALFGVVAYRGLPVSDLPTVDYPTVQRQREPARRRSRDDGVDGGEPARAPVHDHRRRGRDDLVEQRRQQQHHADVRPRPQHRQRGRRRPDGDCRGDAAAAVHADGAAVVPQAEPGRPADPDAQPDVEHAGDVGGRRLRGERPGAAHLDGRTACRRCNVFRARRSTPCACRSIRTSCGRRTSA